ncbi:MAG: hypothetical protein ACR2NZ_09250 [Rubripirellula sp.]
MSRQDDPHSPIESQLAAPPVSVDSGPIPNTPPSRTNQPPDATADLIQSKFVVLAVLFCVTGVLGLPLLWMNKKFSKAERWFWSIVVTIYTAILIWIVIAILMWSYRQIVG